jgi:hypothetical protein
MKRVFLFLSKYCMHGEYFANYKNILNFEAKGDLVKGTVA